MQRLLTMLVAAMMLTACGDTEATISAAVAATLADRDTDPNRHTATNQHAYAIPYEHACANKHADPANRYASPGATDQHTSANYTAAASGNGYPGAAATATVTHRD